MPTFGSTSLERLNTCDARLIQVATKAIESCPIDFGIAEGHRTLERQNQLFKEGKSQLDGINKKGNHNYSPSRAFDIYAWVDGKASWDKSYLSFIAAWILKTADELNISIQWGGFWKSFVDMPHFELKN